MQPGEFSEEQLMSMPLEDLESIVLGKAQNLGKLAGEQDMAAPAPVPGAVPPPPGPDLSNEGMIDPTLVMAATTKLAQLGLPVQPSETLSPDVVRALQGALDSTSPGLYNLSNPDDLEEVLNGISNGQLLDDLAGGAAPAPAGGLPGAPGGGLPGGPAAPAGGPVPPVPGGLPAPVPGI